MSKLLYCLIILAIIVFIITFACLKVARDTDDAYEYMLQKYINFKDKID